MAVPNTPAEAAELLGLPQNARQSAVEVRYRRLAQIYHPDLNPDVPTAHRRMLELNAAWELLTGSRPLPRQEEQRPDHAQARPAPPAARPEAAEQRTKASMIQMPYGVYVIGTVRDGEPNGMVADWVMQIAFEPRLLAVSFENSAYSLESVRHNNSFTVILLPEEGMDLAARFLQPRDGSKIKGRSAKVAAQTHHKLDGAAYRTTDRGCPILDEALSWLECEAEQFIPAGDHTLVIGRVLEGEVLQTGEALTSSYTGWIYGG